MTWNFLKEFQLSKDWQFTDPVEGEIFRIRHKLIRAEYFNKTLARGVIAQGFDDGNINIFKSKLFAYKEEHEIFTLYYPQGLKERSLCFKRLDDSTDKWSIFVEVFRGSPEENLKNYLIARFGEETVNMALTPLLFSGSTDPNSLDKKIPAKKPAKVLSSNDSRTGLRIYSTNQPILLTTGFNESGIPLNILLKLPPNYYHEEMISTAGIYKGDIYALSEEETSILVIEFSSK